jgi:hypothetical protein
MAEKRKAASKSKAKPKAKDERTHTPWPGRSDLMQSVLDRRRG